MWGTYLYLGYSISLIIIGLFGAYTDASPPPYLHLPKYSAVARRSNGPNMLPIVEPQWLFNEENKNAMLNNNEWMMTPVSSSSVSSSGSRHGSKNNDDDNLLDNSMLDENWKRLEQTALKFHPRQQQSHGIVGATMPLIENWNLATTPEQILLMNNRKSRRNVNLLKDRRSWRKRDVDIHDPESPGGMHDTGASASHLLPQGLASQLMLRSARDRPYDVPQIECPPAPDGMERFACPTPDRQGRYRCIDDHVLCDGYINCPSGEDEDRQACMFYKTTKAHLDVLADALLRWARGR
ncbi:uncharacterized protein LOC123301005 [Chrysoperla carnea]|uniref:uncharacterized protein LOC123301005 n=1 Tax=Chrysoperla carnea TaxID=189513 RepID=UPI001D094783|nr:uncharacterized protein LOC123301005 [Chrysoperla carnea]